VLAGQVIPTAREIIALIHEVNPTGREVDKREAARRYAIKTRLQSLLVERFSDEMSVVPDDKEGVVLLRHKYLGVAASHAIVADLEDDARAWVQMQLDLGVVGQAWMATPDQLERRRRERSQAHRRKGHHDQPRNRLIETLKDSAGAAEMVAALDEGRIAQASYDYEAARAALERAHALAPDAPAPLAALLDLLVNQLGLDREALDVAEAAQSTALHSRAALAALALAAARLGERERAEAWGRELDGAEAAEVLRALAARAIGAGDLANATKTLERARQCCPSDPERILVEAQLEQARAAAVAYDEARLAQLAADGDVAAAAALAHEIVKRHPGSTRARALLKEAATQERRVRQQELLAEARADAVHARFKQARQALASAREHGAAAVEIADIERTIVAAEARAARIAHEKSLATVATQLAGAAPEKKAAIATYLGLDRQDRDEIRRRCHAEEWAWLDEIPPGTPAARCEPIAAAVMAARAATALLDADDLDGAERVLAAHRPVLGEHRFGRQLLARLERAQQASEQARALATLEKVSAALRAKDVGGAKDLLDSMARDRLPASSHGELDRLSQALASARQHEVCMDLVDARLAKQRPIGARQLLLERLAESRDEDERTSLRDRLAQVDAEVRKMHLGIDHVPPAGYLASEASEMVTNYGFDRGVDTLLLPGGKIAVLLSAGQAQYAARLVDVDSGEILRLIAWVMGEALMPRGIGVADERLWIQDLLFNYAEISCDSWLPCRQCDLKPDGNRGDAVERCVPVPGADVAWIKIEPLIAPYTFRLRAVDIAHGSVIDLPDDEGDVYSIPGTTPPLLAWFSPGQTLILVSARGQDKVFITIPADGVAIAVAMAPDGDGYVVLCESKDKTEPWLELLLADAAGVERSRLRLPVAHEGAAGVATILPRRLVCVFYRIRDSGQTRLAYLREQDQDGLVLAADVEIPGLTGIGQDPTASTAVAVCKSARGIRLARLDAMPTAFPAGYDELAIPRLFRFVDCSPPPEPERESLFRSAECAHIRESNSAYTDSKLEALAKRVDRSPEAVSTYRLLRLRRIDGRADRLLEYMERQSTKSFFVRLAIAEREALAGRWVGDGLAEDPAATGASDHLLHMRAVAYLRQGRLDDVIESLAGRAAPGPCRLDGLLTLAETLKAEQAGEPMSADAMATPSLATLVRSIFAADRALARGERDEVLRILDQAWIREVSEAQSIARLAEVYLATGRGDPPIARLRASTLMIDFIDGNYSGARSHQLWLGESTWSAERLAELTESAQKWLIRFSWKADAS
jgi:hypothetical protein